MRVNVWSSGGGTQSAAMAALIVRGVLPLPDLAAIVDTEREVSATWDYHEQAIVPALRQVGVLLFRVVKSRYATVDLYGGNGDLLIPAFTATGKLPTFCSSEWKRRVLQRWAREQYPDAQFKVWIGISLDEYRRVKPSTEPAWENWYPLIEQRMTRQDCKALVASMGWPEPPRSSCWMCPNRTAREWALLKAEYPKDFAQACALEDVIRQDDDLWLTKERTPLRDWEPNSEPDLFTGLCDSGYCFI